MNGPLPDDSGIDLARRNGWERWRGGVDEALSNIKGTLEAIEENQGGLHQRITEAIKSGSDRTGRIEKRVAIIYGGLAVIVFAASALVAFFK